MMERGLQGSKGGRGLMGVGCGDREGLRRVKLSGINHRLQICDSHSQAQRIVQLHKDMYTTTSTS
jgi:hypothetical protein